MTATCPHCNRTRKRFPPFHCDHCGKHIGKTRSHFVMDERGPIVWCVTCRIGDGSEAWWRAYRPVISGGGSRAWVHTFMERPFTDVRIDGLDHDNPFEDPRRASSSLPHLGICPNTPRKDPMTHWVITSQRRGDDWPAAVVTFDAANAQRKLANIMEDPSGLISVRLVCVRDGLATVVTDWRPK